MALYLGHKSHFALLMSSVHQVGGLPPYLVESHERHFNIFHVYLSSSCYVPRPLPLESSNPADDITKLLHPTTSPSSKFPMNGLECWWCIRLTDLFGDSRNAQHPALATHRKNSGIFYRSSLESKCIQLHMPLKIKIISLNNLWRAVTSNSLGKVIYVKK